MNLIPLTGMTNMWRVYLNPACIERVSLTDDGTKVVTAGDKAFMVRETPDQILAMINQPDRVTELEARIAKLEKAAGEKEEGK